MCFSPANSTSPDRGESAFVDRHRDRFGVEPICREIEASASAYRARRTRAPPARAVRDVYPLSEIRRVHDGSGGVYGQLKIWDELNDGGIALARCTVERLMRADRIKGCANGKVQVTTRPGSSHVAAREPHALVACHRRLRHGQRFTTPPRRRSDRPLRQREHYTSYEYTERLKRAGIAPSRGRTGTALDSAMAESIMSTLKRELIKRYTWRTRLDLELALVTYIGWYNARCRHRSLKGTTGGVTRRRSPLQMLDSYTQQAAREIVVPK